MLQVETVTGSVKLGINMYDLGNCLFLVKCVYYIDRRDEMLVRFNGGSSLASLRVKVRSTSLIQRGLPEYFLDQL